MKNQQRIILVAVTSLLPVGCGQSTSQSSSLENSSMDETPISENFDVTGAKRVVADFSKVVNPPLLKKVAMYNAGCIQPLSNYERDLHRASDLNVDNLRIDLSIGKSNGTGGQYLVSDDFEYASYNEEDGTYEVDKSSLKYDFSQLDGIVDQLVEQGISPYMSWDYIPYPLQENGKWNNLDQNVTNWREIWEEIYYQYAKHYLDRGTSIGYHEIYNEPDLEILKCWGVFDEKFDGFLNWNDFCLGEDCSPGQGVYQDMYKYGVQGILRADPYATVGGPAFALGEIGVEDWVGFLPMVKREKLPLDFYSFHSYLDGTTWFLPEESRNIGERNEIEKVSQALGKSPEFIKTAVHINEYSGLNDSNGSTNGLTSEFNYYGGAENVFEALDEVVNRTSIQWVHYAQFMESTGGYDPYGVIEQTNGQIKAAYNALKIYQDMPVWRYNLDLGEENDGVKGYVSAENGKIGLVLWNENSNVNESGEPTSIGDRKVAISLQNSPFSTGKRRVYRIDKEHASYFDGVNPELVAEDVATIDLGKEYIYAGSLPAKGVIYITLNEDGKEDFDSYATRTSFAKDIKTSYYYEDRLRELPGSRETYQDYVSGIRGSYSHFDRTHWKMYLGLGNCLGKNGEYANQGHACGGVFTSDLPSKFKVNLQTEGAMKMYNKNTALGFRVDFFDEENNEYTSSVYFHNGLYRDNRDITSEENATSGLSKYAFGTERNADTSVQMEGNSWDIDLTRYAPSGWDATSGKAMLSFDMQNTGPNTRAIFELVK